MYKRALSGLLVINLIFLIGVLSLCRMEEICRKLQQTVSEVHMEESLLADKLDLMEQYVGKKIIDGVVVGPKVDVTGIGDRVVVQEPLEASDIKYRHDRHLLREALEKAIQALG